MTTGCEHIAYCLAGYFEPPCIIAEKLCQTRSHAEMVGDMSHVMWPWTLTYQKFLLCISSQLQDLYSYQKLNTYIYWFLSSACPNLWVGHQGSRLLSNSWSSCYFQFLAAATSGQVLVERLLLQVAVVGSSTVPALAPPSDQSALNAPPMRRVV